LFRVRIATFMGREDRSTPFSDVTSLRRRLPHLGGLGAGIVGDSGRGGRLCYVLVFVGTMARWRVFPLVRSVVLVVADVHGEEWIEEWTNEWICFRSCFALFGAIQRMKSKNHSKDQNRRRSKSKINSNSSRTIRFGCCTIVAATTNTRSSKQTHLGLLQWSLAITISSCKHTY